MTEIDWERLQPLRVAIGTHSAGSGYGCAMNVVSYITGEAEITDYPACADTDLARMVQAINDRVGVNRGLPASSVGGSKLLRPEDAVRVVNLGCMTIGTAGVSYTARALGTLAALQEMGIPEFADSPVTPRGAVSTLYGAGYSPDFLMDFGERVLTKVREYAGLDAAEEVVLPEGVLL